MAMSVNGGNSYGSRRRAGGTMLAEINVTPFVDVVLVLLIIFMLTAHVMDFGLEVDVPKVRPVKESAEELPIVTITEKDQIFLNGKDTPLRNLKSAIVSQFGGKSKGVYVMADKRVVWDVLAQVIAELGEAGFQVNTVTEPIESGARSRK